MNSPKITVLMSVYNGQEYLAEAIDSILIQTFKDFEFLIIDDGSSDDSPDILDAYAKKDKRVKVVRQTNKGLVAALNKALGLARGEYIARMDADDISLPTRLNEQVSFLEFNPSITLVGSGFYFIDGSGKQVGKQGVLVEDKDIKRELCIRNPFGHGTIMIRKNIMKTLGGYSSKVGPVEDYEMWLRIAERERLAGIPKLLYKWRINPAGISQNNIQYQLSQTDRLAVSFRRHYDHRASLKYLLRQRKFYRHLNYDSYTRFMEDQVLFFKVYLDERKLLGVLKLFLFVVLSPSIFWEQIKKTNFRILSKAKRLLMFMLKGR